MVDRVWPVDAVSGAPAYSGRAARQASLAPLLAGATAARPLGAVSGVRPGTSQTIVTATSTTWTVTPFGGVIDGEAAAEAGPYGFAFDANKTGSINAAHMTYPRWDTLAVQVSDPAESDGSSVPSIAIVYTAGTAAASPAEPALPARSFLLARIVVPQSGGGSPSVVWRAPVSAAAGGIFINPPDDQISALAAVATADCVQFIRRKSTGTVEQNAGSGWVVLAGPSTVTTFTPTWTNFTPGASTVSAWYTLTGGWCEGAVDVVLGTGWNFSTAGTTSFAAPVAAYAANDGRAVGHGVFVKTGTGYSPGPLLQAADGSIRLFAQGAAGTYVGASPINNTVPHAWTSVGSPDRFALTFRYRVA